MPVIIDDLRKFSRSELIDVIAEYQKNEKRLNERIEALESELSSRQIILEESGSIANAALSINKVFEASQMAADQYLESVKAAIDFKLQEAEKTNEEANQKLKEAEIEAKKIVEEAREKARIEAQEIDLKIAKLCEENPGLNIKRST